MPLAFAIRADASSEIGSGHVMRCLTLANELARRGARIAFICRQITPVLRQMVRQAGHEVVMLPSAPPDEPPNDGPAHAPWLKAHWRTDAVHTAEVLRELGGVDWLIVDHYALDARWEVLQRPYAQRIMVIDDLADRPHDCDLLLDVTIWHDEENYNSLVSSGCKMLLGPSYVLLRPQFQYLRVSSLRRRKKISKLRCILISFGGNAPLKLTAAALKAVSRLPDRKITVNVALGEGNPNEMGLSLIARIMPQKVRFHNFSSDMAKLMHDADLAIGATGTSSWERMALGLPAIMVAIAENQHEALEHFSATGGILPLSAVEMLHGRKLDRMLCEFVAAPKKLLRMSLAAAKIVDGAGVQRAVQKLLTTP